jgi:hypothetical protein
MFTFTYSVTLPANMSSEDRQAFFNAVNAAINPVVQAASDKFQHDFGDVSTYVVDENNVAVC